MGTSPLAKLSALRGLSARSIGAPPPAGIEFGVSALKVMQITNPDSPSLVAAGAVETPEELRNDIAGRLRFQMEELPGLVKKAKIKASRAVCAIPAPAMFCKHFQLVGGKHVEWGPLVAQQVATKMGCDASAVVCRHELVHDGGASNKSELIAFAASRSLIEQMMSAVKSAKLKMVGIHSEHHAAVRSALAGSAQSEPRDVVLLIDLGYETTKVTIAHGTRVMFARVIEYGGRDLDDAVVTQSQCIPSKALERRLQMTSFQPVVESVEPADEADRQGDRGVSTAFVRAVEHAVDLSEPAEILTDEVSMCLRYHQAVSPEHQVTKLAFVGGESRHAAWCQEIARRLRISAEIVDPMARIARTGSMKTPGVDFSAPQPGWAVPVGLCLCPTDL